MSIFRRNSMAANARQGLKRAKSDARRFVRRIGDAGTQAAQGIATAGARMRDAQVEAIDAGRSYVRANPLKSSAITMVLGAMAASLFILGRRH